MSTVRPLSSAAVSTMLTSAQVLEHAATSRNNLTDQGKVHVHLDRVACALIARSLRERVQIHLERSDVPTPP